MIENNLSFAYELYPCNLCASKAELRKIEIDKILQMCIICSNEACTKRYFDNCYIVDLYNSRAVEITSKKISDMVKQWNTSCYDKEKACNNKDSSGQKHVLFCRMSNDINIGTESIYNDFIIIKDPVD